MDAKQNVTKVNHVLLGEAFPLGATPYDDGCNFAVYAPDAKAVALCLFHNDTEEPIEEILLPEKKRRYLAWFLSQCKSRSFIWLSSGARRRATARCAHR